MNVNYTKIYPASEVAASRNIVMDNLRRLEIGQAFNIAPSKRSSFSAAISRLHKNGEGRFRTKRTVDNMIAVIRIR